MKTKIIIITLICLLTSKINAQLPINKETGKVVFTDIVKLDGKSKKQIYDKAKLWIVSTLKSGDNMVELNGTSSDQIVGTGNIAIPSKEINSIGMLTNFMLNFKFIVFVKDDRLKYNIENFSLQYQHILRYTTSLEDIIIGVKVLNKNKKEKFRNQVRLASKKHIDNLINNFISTMNKKQKDDW